MSLRSKSCRIIGVDSEVDAGFMHLVSFDSSDPIFAGHFPGQPIVPGACLVQIAENLTSQQLGRTVHFNAIKNLKFRQPITPDMQVVFVINGSKIEIRDKSLTELYAQFTATYLCPDSDVQ